MKNSLFSPHNAARMGRVLIILGLMLVLFVGMLFVNQMKAFNAPADMTNMATINVTGTGTAYAVPDVATESFTVEAKAATVADAQTTVTATANAAIAFLKSSGVAEKDIQTSGYNANPDYSYPTPCASNRPCPAVSSAPKVVDYDVSESVTVKIRDTSKVGAIVDGLGQRGVTGLSGPNFMVDNPDAINAAARAKAIDDAKGKAQLLAQQLGVTLVRITSFSDNGGGNVYPMAMDMKSEAVGATAAPAPVIAPGQNQYTSNVSITYEIQ